MLRLIIGLGLTPLSLLACAAAARVLWSLPGSAPAAYPFLSGFGVPILLRIFIDMRSSWLGRAITFFYVVLHELAHVLATWTSGGKVFSFKAGARGGRVDVSDGGAFVSLAPYCVPLLTVCVVVGYRAWTWSRPEPGGAFAFLFLMGATLSFHLLATFECLTTARQPDLEAAGGAVFSAAIIALANAVVVLALVKALFPRSVELAVALRWSAAAAAALASRFGAVLAAPR